MPSNRPIFLSKFLISRNPFGRTARSIYSFLPEIRDPTSNPSSPNPKPSIIDIPFSKFHRFLCPTHSNPSFRIKNCETVKRFSSEPSAGADHSEKIDEINLKFAEAREEIDMALESKETVYFDEEAEAAREAVKVVLDMYGGLMTKLPEKEKGALQRSMGLKIEQLKAELEQLND